MTADQRREQLAQRFVRLLFNAGPLAHHNITVSNEECELIRDALRASLSTIPADTALKSDDSSRALLKRLDSYFSLLEEEMYLNPSGRKLWAEITALLADQPTALESVTADKGTLIARLREAAERTNLTLYAEAADALSALQSDRNAVIEECAKIADSRLIELDAGFGWGAWTPEEHELMRGSAIRIARGIRALIADQRSET